MSAPTIDEAARSFPAATIEAVLGVPASTVRKWVERGHVRKYGRDLYDGDDVINRWAAAVEHDDT